MGQTVCGQLSPIHIKIPPPHTHTQNYVYFKVETNCFSKRLSTLPQIKQLGRKKSCLLKHIFILPCRLSALWARCSPVSVLSTRDRFGPSDGFQDGVVQMFDWMWGFSRPLQVPVADIVHRCSYVLGNSSL